MTSATVAMVKDEIDIIRPFLAHALTQTDFAVVADNGSTDGTRDVILEFAESTGAVTLIDDPERAYYQSAKVTRLAYKAAAMGAEWVVAADADEFWLARNHPTVGAALSTLDDSVCVATSVLSNYVTTSEDDPDEPNPALRMRWRLRELGEMPKVACRPLLPVTVEQGNHGARYPTETADGLLVALHFPYRSVEQTIRKARNGAEAYAAAPDLPAHQGDHWRKYGAMSDEQLTEVFNTWWRFEAGDKRLVFDPAYPERQAA